MTRDVHDRIRDYWDRDSDTYDETRSHAISDPLEASAWRQALADTLPEPGSKVLDVGAGTGALSLLAAELGYEVTALDLSPGMLGRAELKARERGLEERMRFVVGSGTDAPEGPFDAVMERHVLWTLPDPVGALAQWREVSSRLVLFEGVWGEDDLRRRAKDLAAATGPPAAVVLLQRAGHACHLEQPEAFVNVLESWVMRTADHPASCTASISGTGEGSRASGSSASTSSG